MTIKEIKEETIEQRCDNCEAVREIAIDELILGIIVEEHTIPNVIRLPTCDQCSTTEFLFVSEDAMQKLLHEPEDGDRAEVSKSTHQLLVDQLGKRLSQQS